MPIYTCITCGGPYFARRKKRSGKCDDCGLEALRGAVIGMHKKEGPYWEKWKEAMRGLESAREAHKRSICPEG